MQPTVMDWGNPLSTRWDLLLVGSWSDPGRILVGSGLDPEPDPEPDPKPDPKLDPELDPESGLEPDPHLNPLEFPFESIRIPT